MTRSTLTTFFSIVLFATIASHLVGCGSSSGGASGVANEGIYLIDAGDFHFLPDLATGIDQLRNASVLPKSASAITVDSTGIIYATLPADHQIVRIDPSDPTHPTFYPPGAPDLTRTLYAPDGIAVDRSGRIYVSDSSGSQIVRMDDIQGNGWKMLGVPRGPRGLALDPSGRIYWASTGNRVYRVDSMDGGGLVWIGEGNLPASESFVNPTDVSVDVAGHIFVADTGNKRIVYMEDMAGTHFQSYLGHTGCTLKEPTRISQDTDGRLYIVDQTDQKVVRIDGINGTNYTARSFTTPNLAGICVVGRPNPAPGPITGCSSTSSYTFADIHADLQHPEMSIANGINNSGDVVGTYRLAGETETAGFRWHAGQVTELGRGEALGINNGGMVVGRSHDGHPATLPGEVLLPTIGDDDDEGAAVAVNDHNIIAGWVKVVDTAPVSHAVAWNNGVAIDLNPLLDADWSIATGINNSDVVVGYAQKTVAGVANVSPFKATIQGGSATIQFIDKTPFQSARALCINDSGKTASAAGDFADIRNPKPVSWLVTSPPNVLNLSASSDIGEVVAMNNNDDRVGFDQNEFVIWDSSGSRHVLTNWFPNHAVGTAGSRLTAISNSGIITGGWVPVTHHFTEAFALVPAP